MQGINMKANPTKVFIFEDNPGDIRLLEEFLRTDKNDQYVLIVEGNLRKGLLRLAKEKPDVILLDLGLPDSQGMDTFSKVHSQAADVPIVILTGLAEIEIAVEAVKAGAQDYLVKGDVFDSMLRRSLRYAIERKRVEEQLRESEKRYHLVFENSGTANTIFDIECRVILQNSSSQKLTTPMDAVGKTALEIFGPDQGIIVTERMSRVLSSGKAEVFESKFDMSGGSKWMRSSYFPLYQERGELVGIQVISQDITEQKHAEEALRESEESFHSVVENAPIGIYRMTPDGRITMVNTALLRVLGYKSFDELAQRDLSKERHEPEYPRLDFQELMKKKGEIIGLESAWKRKDGSTIFVRESARLVRDENHQPRYYEGTVEDITERKQAEEAFRGSETKYKDLFENSLLAISTATPDGRLLNVNLAYAQMYGYRNPDEMMAEVNDIGHQLYTDSEDRKEVLRILAENGSMMPREMDVVRRDGSHITVLVSAVEVRDPDGRILYYQANHIDITKRKQAEDALHKSEEQFRLITENMQDMIVQADMEGLILYASPSHKAILNYDPEFLVGKSIYDFIHPEDIGSVREFTHATLQEQTLGRQELRARHADGHYLWLESTGALIIAENGSPAGAVYSNRDITEQKKIEEQIEVLSRIPDESPNPILRVTKEGILLYSNPSSALLLALWNTQIGQSLPDEWRKRIKNVFTSGHYQEIEVRAGEEVYSLILAPILDQGYVNLYGREITSRKLAEETLIHQNEEILKRNMELDRLYQATGSLLSSTPFNLKSLATTIVDVVLKEYGQANCSLFIIQKDSNELVRLASGGPYTDQVIDKKITLDGPGLVPQVISTGKLMNVIDIHTIPGFVPNWDAAQSELTIPLKVENNVIGVIDIQSSERGAFSPGDERLMSIFAERAALVLERGRLDGELERRLQQLSSLRSIDMAITSSMDIDITLQILLDNLMQNMGIHAADILIFDPVMQTFRFTAGLGFRTQALQHTNLRLGDGYAGQAARDRQIITIRDLLRNTGGLQRSADLHSEGFVSYVGAPLIAKGQVKGVLEIFQRETFEMDQEQRAFLEMLAGQAAIAIDSSQLFEKLQNSNSELMMAYDETIEGWSRAMDLRDEETEGHSRRVTELTLRLANIMMIKPEELLQIRRGALLHDIGKIGIPDSILRKPGPLTDEEWVIMRRHPQLAHDMLAPIIYLRLAIDIPWCHHEKWDGTGYPRGLKGDEIPLAARIFAVVDVWDALCSDRPYRKAWPVDKVRSYIQEQAGKYFDPRIVESFLKELSRVE